LPWHKPGAAEDFGHHSVDVDAVSDRQMVRTVRPCDGVIGAKVLAEADGHRLLTCREVHFSWYLSSTNVPGWQLVAVILTKDRAFKGADPHHHAVTLNTDVVSHCTPQIRRNYRGALSSDGRHTERPLISDSEITD
jgi:hypothetical protein